MGGNIDCKCLKENQQKELITVKGEESLYTNDLKNTQLEDENIIRAKAQNFITPGPGNQVDENSHNSEEDDIEIPPILNENYMDYAMDFFDEINKYRCDSELFNELKKRNPTISINNATKHEGIEVGWNQKLYNFIEEFLFNNKENSVNLEIRRKITENFNKDIINFYEVNVGELDLEKNILELVDKFYTKHNKIFVENYTVGAVAACKNNDSYRILLVLA